MRLPVAAKIALHKAGAITETPGDGNHLQAGAESAYPPGGEICDPRVGLEQRQPRLVVETSGTPERPRVLG